MGCRVSFRQKYQWVVVLLICHACMDVHATVEQSHVFTAVTDSTRIESCPQLYWGTRAMVGSGGASPSPADDYLCVVLNLDGVVASIEGDGA